MSAGSEKNSGRRKERSVQKKLCTLGMSLLAAVATAQTSHTILTNGPAANHVNIVLLSEGYTQSQLPAFLADATNAVDQLFSQSPYREYKSYFNATAIAVASAESGSDHPNWPQYRNTYFNSVFDETKNLITIPPNAIDRNYANGRGRVDALLQQFAPQHELVILLVNDPLYGGGGGDILIASKHVARDELLLHESAHTLARLGDEYSTPFPGFPDVEEPNTTRETRREFIKWKAWIDPLTPIPTPGTSGYETNVGLFQGAHYQASGWYRPKLDCKMRTLGVPFCEVCSEALVLSFYKKARPIQKKTPSSATVALSTNENVTFTVQVASPETHPLSLHWFANGVEISNAIQTNLTLDATALRNGSNSVSVRVEDRTEFVRADPEQRLVQTATWTVYMRERDWLWQNSEGRLAAWFMNGTNFLGSTLLQNGKPLGAEWRFGGFADFNADGSRDILWRNEKTGLLIAWLMSGSEIMRVTTVAAGHLASSDWRIAGVADFNADNSSDILWHSKDGRLAVWLLQNANFDSLMLLRAGQAVPASWQLLDVADFNGDSSPDLLWQNSQRQLALWFMDQTQVTSSRLLLNGNPLDFRLRFGGSGDFDNNGSVEPIWQRDDGQLLHWSFFSQTTFSSELLRFGPPPSTGWHSLGVR